jgi:hypothetical protein
MAVTIPQSTGIALGGSSKKRPRVRKKSPPPHSRAQAAVVTRRAWVFRQLFLLFLALALLLSRLISLQDYRRTVSMISNFTRRNSWRFGIRR